jgi:hypothetical protein
MPQWSPVTPNSTMRRGQEPPAPDQMFFAKWSKTIVSYSIKIAHIELSKREGRIRPVRQP